MLPFLASTPALISSIREGFSGCFTGDIGCESSDFSDVFCAETECAGAGFTDSDAPCDIDFPAAGLKDIDESSGSLGAGDCSAVGLVGFDSLGLDDTSVAGF
ncbi:hypothetical protein MNL02_06180 [Bartonella krasnovii]|uniref:hypothetical protein n=1 Tax=Bartonella krasnovii TaxID=2267275 RepID=UPI001F4CF108|nr:hypothetical protein [Bartonella krasnovii]UNF51654.1 hypothetical protein MNL02_06180 [Bartonella krasnovii]